ncbi:MAG: 30S ribosomal protein S7 [Thermoplasmata archaeon]|uniref:Small ribosomal subunit protein uS7 n=1 Tax=Candidatus Sysuiplasma superficiale TaxID=2823368 RepID=A0A8J8CCF7_9ARCH|nr:30S ribosomal protein S7 [Candidatus Sysuiplasma superficiale]MBX8643599.1 30S ribosomal protein S7 [Candidatus Sysuiplasma superficiale]MCL4347457.1 30S ribosomal protein S7 [Candidatus Thermoplasmatota archaeon]
MPEEDNEIVNDETEEQAEKEDEPQQVLLYNALLFGKYDLSEVTVSDPGLARYINLTPIYVPHTSGKHAGRNFGKTKVNIVERLINQMMRTENYTGKKSKSIRTVEKAFDIINSKTGKNPVQILVSAIEHAAPREEITRLQFGGISVPKAVDVSSSRRLDLALRYICLGAVNASHGSTKAIEQCLADELILASNGDMNSSAVSKRDEIERVAMSAR